VCLSHNDLATHYQTNFSLMQHHKYSLSEIDEMIPWEREVYLSLLIDYLKQEEQARKEAGH